MRLELTEKGQRACGSVKKYYDAIRLDFGPNAMDRVLYDKGDLPAAVVIFAVGNPSREDLEDMVRQGYAAWER